MDYLKDILNTNVRLNNFSDGLFMVKTRLRLAIASASKNITKIGDVQKDRRTVLNITEKKGVTDHKDSTITQILGEEYTPRQPTHCTTTGTIYGAAQTWAVEFAKNSIFGLNRKYLDTDGRPNTVAISKYLREVSTSVEMKEQRINLFINKIFAGDFYDNATSLLVVLFAKMHTLRTIKRMPVYEHVVKIRYTTIATWDMSDEMTAFESFRRYMNHGVHAATVGSQDTGVLDKIEKLFEWYNAHPKPMTNMDNKPNVPNPIFEDDEFILRLKVWKMYTYDDGHSTSGISYGEHYGFRRGRFVVPEQYAVCTPRMTKILSRMVHAIPTVEADMVASTAASGFINCSGLNAQEASFLDVMLHGNHRSTPFLIDQSLQFDFEVSSVKAIHCPELTNTPFTINEEFVGTILTKLITNHKWYEDALAAQRALRYWVAQPANETVESHWWTYTERRLSLPALGLKRAAMGMLLLDEGVCSSLESMKYHTELMRNNDNILLESLMANTCWYWGEFLAIYNAPNLDEILARLHTGTDGMVSPLQRADAMYSAVIGRAVPRAVYPEMATYLESGIQQGYSKTIYFGNANFNHVVDYGYMADNERVTLNTLVPPSGVALITGLAGPLIANTPYAAIFNINSVNRKKHKFELFHAANYQDLWAINTVSRWQGYDVKYWHPNRTGTHRSYAANNVNVAQPPVTPAGLDEATSYIIEGFERRGYAFGTSYEMLLLCDTTFYWLRDTSQAQTSYDFNARQCGVDTRQYFMPKFFKQVLSDIETYPTHVLAEFDYAGPSFHITELDVPVTLPQGTEVLTHTDVPIQMEIPPDTGPPLVAPAT